VGFAYYHVFHFLLPWFFPEMAREFLRSVGFAVFGGGAMVYVVAMYGSVWRLYFVPVCIFWFWLSVFTYFQHRHPKTPWKEDKDWTRIYAGLFATVHVDFPSWVEFLVLDVNWHIPHHVSPRIPWYNLRSCTQALFTVYGNKLAREEFGWDLIKKASNCIFLLE